MRQILAAIITLITIGYPFIFFFGLPHFELRTILLVLAVPLLLRFFTYKKHGIKGWLIPLIALLFFLIVLLKDSPQFFMLTPVLINLGLLTVFGGSLFTSQPLVERFARMQTQDLTTEELLYCRRINWLWCIFFLINGSIAGYLAWINDLALWTLYNGMIGYLAIGIFFGLELLYRHWRFRHYTGSWTDPFFKKLFPPK